MDKEEFNSLLQEILQACPGINERMSKILLPGTAKNESHGYQLQITSEIVNTQIACIKSIAQKKNLAVDVSEKNSITIYRPCFAHYSDFKKESQ